MIIFFIKFIGPRYFSFYLDVNPHIKIRDLILENNKLKEEINFEGYWRRSKKKVFFMMILKMINILEKKLFY